MTEFVPQYYQMDPETEDVLYGKELKNGMRVLIEAAPFKADLDAYDPDGSPFMGDKMPAHVEDSAMRQNRWCKVTRFVCDEEDIHFIGEYDDGTKHVRSREMWLGWIVKKDTIPEEVPYIIEGSNEEIEVLIRGDMIKKIESVKASSGFFGPIARAVGKEESLTESMTATSLKAAGYSNVAISQITRLTEKRVQEILERHAETPFLKSSTQKNLMGDLASGRLILEVPPFQDGRDVTAIVKPGPNYRTATFTQAKFDRFILENKEFFSSRPYVRFSHLAELYNGQFCTREDNSVSWQLDHPVIRELAMKYWETYDFETDTFTTYNGYGLTAGQIMALDMVQRGDPTKNAGVNDIKGDGVTDDTAAIQDFIERNRR